MYPPWLELGEPEQQERQVHFLDLNIWHDGTVWQSKLYDKRIKLEAMGLKLNKFPHVESKLVIKCKYGIITSQLFRYANACTRTKDFLHASADLYVIFIKKEYNPKIMDRFSPIGFDVTQAIFNSISRMQIASHSSTSQESTRQDMGGVSIAISNEQQASKW
jgi:hypothetical protein